MVTTTDARGNVTTYFYDDAGRRTKVRNALNQETTVAYDANGNQFTMTDALLRTTTFEYDDNNRRAKTTYHDSSFETVGYDALGRSVSKQNLLKEPTVLLLPNVSGFQQTDSDLIKAFVEQGGVVVAFGPQIPMGRTYERKELFGVDEAGGMSGHTAVRVNEAVGARVKVGSRFALQKTQLPVWTLNKAKVIATFEDNSAAVVANRFGKGMVVSFFPDAWTAARDFPELTRDVIDYALSAAGAESMVDIIGANENVDIAVGKTSEGFSLAVVNHDSSKLEVIVKPTKSSAVPEGEWVDLVTGNAIQTVVGNRPLNLTISGSGFRALEFRRRSRGQ